MQVIIDMCQRVLGDRGMPDEWKSSVIVLIFNRKDDVMRCGSYREVKLLEHAMKIIERIQKRQVLTLINVNKMQFGYMPRKGTVAVIFIVRRMQEE